MNRAPHIEVRDVTHVFDSERRPLTALTAIDLHVQRGEFVSIVGPSGGGKTTLLKAIGGLLEPTSGTILIDGMPPADSQRSKSIGFVFQDPTLLAWRTVFENIRLPLLLNKGDGGNGSHAVERLLDAVGLDEFRDYYPHQLSGGMRHRVAVARALVSDPTVLLMDEPLGALDEMTRSTMRYELVRLWESSRKTVVFVTHSVPEAVLLSDRVVVMSSRPGRILANIDVRLPRPRSEDLDLSAEFIEYTREIREGLSMEAPDGPRNVEAPAAS
jgi:NitT/TauT family transport system ATP-binding protein